MKNWIRIFLVCFVLIGGTAFFAYQYLNQFNSALNSLSASSFAIAKIPPTPFSIKTNKERFPAPTPTPAPAPAPETIATSATSTETSADSTSATSTESTESTDLKLSFIFRPKNDEVYIGCIYRLSFQSSTAISSLEVALIDAGSRETVEPSASGLAKENKIEPDSPSLDWKVRAIWPGEYYIKVTSISGVDARSKVFTIRKMPKDISADEKEKNCKESGGSF